MTDEPLTDSLTADEVAALADVYHEPLGAEQLLTRAGLKARYHPRGGTAEKFWEAVNDTLRGGALPGARRLILQRACEAFPANRDFDAGLAAAVQAEAALLGPTAAASAGPAPAAAPGAAPVAVPAPVAASQVAPVTTAGSAGAAAGSAGPRRSPVVFISYAHESPTHIDEVRQLYFFLRDNGIDAVFDEVAAAQRQNWQLWMTQELGRADFVVVVASAEYKRRAEGQVPANEGRGLQQETAIIGEKLYRNRPEWTRRILPVLLPGHEPDEVPTWLGGYSATNYRVASIDAAGCEQLLRALTDQPVLPARPLGAVPHLPSYYETATDPRAVSSGGTPAATSSQALPAPATSGVAPPAPPAGGTWDFLVSAAEQDRRWGSWVAHYLADEGHTVHPVSWGLVTGQGYAAEFDAAVRTSTRTIALLSQAYLDSTAVETAATWQHAFSRDPQGRARGLIPVRVGACQPAGFLGNITYIDLVGLAEPVAVRRLKDEIEASLRGHRRTGTAPPFPG
jgi:hypothetical protein